MVLALLPRTHRTRMSEKRRVLGFYGIIEFGDYLNSLAPIEHSFELEDQTGCLLDCSREEVLRRFQSFCGGDEQRFRVRIIRKDPRTGTITQWDKTLRRNKPPGGLLSMLAFWRGKQRRDGSSDSRRPPGPQ